MNQTLKNRPGFGPLHDKSVRKSAIPPPRLFRLRNGIHLPPGGAVLVRRGNRAAADAGRWRGLPVPGLSAEDGGADGLRHRHFVFAIEAGFDVPRMMRSVISAFTRVMGAAAVGRPIR
jgi:hypothetical protein